MKEKLEKNVCKVWLVRGEYYRALKKVETWRKIFKKAEKFWRKKIECAEILGKSSWEFLKKFYEKVNKAQKKLYEKKL